MLMKRVLFHFHVDLDVGVRRIDIQVIKPGLDYCEVNAGLKQVHRRRVPECVGSDFFGSKRWALGGRLFDPSADNVANSEASDWFVVRIGEKAGSRGVMHPSLSDIPRKRLDGILPQRNCSGFSALSGQRNRERFF